MRRGPLSGLLAGLVLLGQGGLPAGVRVLPRRSFRINGTHFVLEEDGKLKYVQLRAGEMHYFRVPEVHWEDRLLRLRAMGLNAVSTYVPWNWHEQVEGKFDFSSERKDLVKFLTLADRLGLLAVLRPGPYICAEWDLGGLPAWLLRHTIGENMTYRTSNPQYLDYVDRFWSDLLPRVKPLLVENGGPVTMVQLENEFGHFGNASGPDRAYFNRLEQVARRHLGPNVLLITTDAAPSNAAGLGTTPSLFAATNMGPWFEPKQHVQRLLKLTDTHNKHRPELVMELWTGWFLTSEYSAFHEQHFKENATSLVNYVKVLLDRGASFTLYMAHGGTNFGFWNSAGALNRQISSQTTGFITTSYDYSAPISEEGRHGFGGDGIDKYKALRELLSQYRRPWEPPLPAEPPAPVLAAYPGDQPGGAVRLGRRVPLRDSAVLAALCQGGWQPEPSGKPTPMELHGQQVGLAFYRYVPATNATASASSFLLRGSGETSAPSQEEHMALKLKARDRVTVWSGGRLLEQARPSVTYGGLGKLGVHSVGVPVPKRARNTVDLDVLVEHLGRRSYVKRLGANLARESYEDWKGMREAWLGGRMLQGGWQYCGLPLADLYASKGSAPEPSGKGESSGPAFFEGSFKVKGEPADTFLRLHPGKWQAGTAFMNGFNLGRYQRGARGPFDFYVPKSALRSGTNTVVLLEMDPPDGMQFSDALVSLTAKRGPMFP